MQFLSYDDDAKTVRTYHTVPSKAGTPAFEHVGEVPLAGLQVEDDIAVVPCPVAGCVTMCFVPLRGDEDAQRLHARTRWAKGQVKSLSEAARQVVDEVRAKGGQARLDPGRG